MAEGTSGLTVTDHAKGILDKAASSVSSNPKITLVAILVMIVLILFLGYHYYTSSSTTVIKTQFRSGGLNPRWWNGGGDAGNYGPVHRAPTRHHTHPFRHVNRNRNRNLNSNPEFLPGNTLVRPTSARSTVDGVNMVTCPPGSRPYNSGKPGEQTTCVKDNDEGSQSPLDDMDDNGIYGSCSDGWSPEAIAEAGALSTVGSFAHDTYGEKRLQSMINYSSGASELMDTGVFGTKFAVASHDAGLF